MIGSLMNSMVVALVFLVCGVTKLAPLGVVRVPLFGEILLRGYCEHKFLVTFTADEDPRFKTALHCIPSLIEHVSNLIREVVDRFVDRQCSNVTEGPPVVNKNKRRLPAGQKARQAQGSPERYR